MDAFIEELNQLFSSQKGGYYKVYKNTNYDDYNSKADILIFAEFNCNVYSPKTRDWDHCYKCILHSGCNVSKEFEDLCDKFGYKFDWVNRCMAGLYKNPNEIKTKCGCRIIRDSKEHDGCVCDDEGENWICENCYKGEYDKEDEEVENYDCECFVCDKKLCKSNCYCVLGDNDMPYCSKECFKNA